MRKTLYIIVAILIVFPACERKSGRKAPQNKTEISPKRNSRAKRRKPSTIAPNTYQTANSSKKEISGSEIFQKYNSAVFMVFTSDGFNTFQGSGFFISKNGLAVSNYHVFQGTGIGYERIKLFDGKIYKVASIIARSEEDDFILFRVEADGDSFNSIPVAQTRPKVGEKAYAIGSPRGLENTFSSGEISQFRGNNFIQINVPIDHGSSGGALINRFGEVVGITTSGFDDSGANLNFAISIDVIKKYL